MKKIKSIYYEMIVSVFEKYGFDVVTSLDRKSIYISKIEEKEVGIPFREIESVFRKEELDEYIDDVQPVHVATWKLTVI